MSSPNPKADPASKVAVLRTRRSDALIPEPMPPTVVLPLIGAVLMLSVGGITWGTPFFWLWVAESIGIASIGILAHYGLS